MEGWGAMDMRRELNLKGQGVDLGCGLRRVYRGTGRYEVY